MSLRLTSVVVFLNLLIVWGFVFVYADNFENIMIIYFLNFYYLLFFIIRVLVFQVRIIYRIILINNSHWIFNLAIISFNFFNESIRG